MQDKREYSEIFVQLTTEFKDESDRAVALLAAAYLDELLKDLIQTVMVIESEGIRKDLFKGGSAPLATFSSRILLSFCLGLISQDQKIDLNHIRSIRNDFAHQLLGRSFNSDTIANSCSGLVGAKAGGASDSNRSAFVKSSVRLMVELIIKIQKTKEPIGGEE